MSGCFGAGAFTSDANAAGDAPCPSAGRPVAESGALGGDNAGCETAKALDVPRSSSNFPRRASIDGVAEGEVPKSARAAGGFPRMGGARGGGSERGGGITGEASGGCESSPFV